MANYRSPRWKASCRAEIRCAESATRQSGSTLTFGMTAPIPGVRRCH